MTAICLSSSHKRIDELKECLSRLRKDLGLLEIRVDLLDPSEIKKLPSFCRELKDEEIPFIWTLRSHKEGGEFKGSGEEKLKLTQMGDTLEADYIDIEAFSEIPEKFSAKFSQTILSYHDFQGTPRDPEEILKKMSLLKPDILKVAFKASSASDLRKVMELYHHDWSVPLIAISMGEWGEISRTFPAKWGLPWSYAYDPKSKQSAPGQFDLLTMKHLLRLDRVNPDTRLFAVIGDPIAHSLSAFLHNKIYAKKSINALYGKIHIDEIEEFEKLNKILDLQGVSVTLPYKEKIVSYSESSSGLENVGAANTLIKSGQTWLVKNTDIEAAIQAIKTRLAPDATPRVLLLGAGGVSRGLAWGMSELGWKVTVSNRTQSRADQLATDFGLTVINWEERIAQGFDIVVNGTLIGMSPDISNTPIEFKEPFAGIVFDTVYTPERTRFLNEAEAQGAKIISGREMFHRQAALQHQHWFGGQAPNQEMSKILKEKV